MYTEFLNLIFLENNFTKISYHNTRSRDCLLFCYDTFFVFYINLYFDEFDLPIFLSVFPFLLFSLVLFLLFFLNFSSFFVTPLLKKFFFSIVQDFFLFLGQTFWSSLSFFVGMLTFGDLDDCRYYIRGWF
ncbi:hypothetical protein GLOIN_2v1672299 [Rhizophagus irregularis DAOM 181602=DAOM 197198]|nr:hypothetical protein GLOIN_2v1672299 [Rhizophagus irregularis DAOM 181602=DAOM 197198]